MSEIQKHIESCRAEDVLSQSMEQAATEDIAQAALQPLLAQTMQGYVPVATTAPTSPIAELPNVLISIIRRVATKPLAILGERPAKQSLLGTLLDTWNAIRQRLAGNPSLGIPDRRADMSGHSLPTALALLSDRKITNGGSTTDGIPDGMSLLRLLTESSAKAQVTELVDDNEWDAFGVSVPISTFPNVSKVTTHVRSIEQDAAGQSTFIAKTIDELNAPYLEYIGVKRESSYNYSYYYQCLANTINSEVVELPSLKRIFNTSSDGNSNWAYGKPAIGTLPNCKRLLVPKLSDIRTSCSGWLGKGTGTQTLAVAPECLELITNIGGDTNRNNASADYKFIVAPKLQRFVLGGVLTTNNDKGLFNTTSEDLIDIELGGATCSLYMNDWNPTNALRSDVNDLVPSGSTCQTNLEQFLQNFRDHIALRLTDQGSGLTLTLSQAVRNAIHAAEATYGIEDIIVNQKHWTLSPAPSA